MTSRLLLAGSSLALVTVLGSAPALAEPDFFSDIGLTPVEIETGPLADLSVWRIEGDRETIWVHLPEQGIVVAGYAFSEDGSDIGAAPLGATPVDVWTSLNLTPPEAAEVSPEDTASSDPSISDILPPGTGTSTTQPEGQDTASAQEQPSGPLAQEIVAQASQAIEGRDEEETRALLANLVARLDAAETPADFQIALIEWREEISGEEIIGEEERASIENALSVPSGQSAVDPAEIPQGQSSDPAQDAAAAAPSSPEAEASSDPEPRSSFDPTSSSTEESTPEESAENAEAGAQDLESVLSVISEDMSWISVGADGAKPVYMIIDPTCPHCARAISNLRADVENGEIQLRAVLVPLLSEASLGKVGAILASDNPARALWEHEIEYARSGRSDLGDIPLADLPEADKQDVGRNYEASRNLGIPGVPFFSWRDQGGEARALSGVPDAGYFTGENG